MHKIFARRIFFSSSNLLQGLDTEMAAFDFFLLLHCRCVHSGCIQTFTSTSRHCHFHHHRPLGHSFRLLIAHCSLSVTYFYFSCCPLPFRVVYFAFPSPSSASYSFSCPAIGLSLVHFSFSSKVDFSTSKESQVEP